MGLLDRLFKTSTEPKDQPNLSFGRYTDSYKEKSQYDAWDQALQAFEDEKYMDSYRAFFDYLRDPKLDNVQFEESAEGQITFEILQGSKKVMGYANEKHFKAEAKVALADELHIGFMRRLIEQNFDLKYSRFALDKSDDIHIVFDTYTLDGSPYKLYYALKEVATKADKQDDLLIDEFDMLYPTDTSHLVQLPEAEKEAKYQFILEKIREVLEEVESGALDAHQYPGGIAYLLLDLCYKIDYLTKPEGYLMEALERIHREYFAKDGRTTLQKNHALRKEYQKLIERPKEDFFKEMYTVVSTFGITTPVNHDKVAAFIDGELHNMDWYREQKYDRVALAVPGYIIGFCLFNYAVPPAIQDLFHLYFQITESAYFRKLGYTIPYVGASGTSLSSKEIKRALRTIEDKHHQAFPNMKIPTGSLQYGNLVDFAKTFLLIVRNLDMTKAD